MKKTLYILILLTFGMNLYAQNSEKEFVVTEFVNGNIYREKTEEIKINNESIDIAFMRKHFFIPYYFPQKFIDTKYKNESIVVWRNENKEKEYKTNWTNTFIYDSDSRIIEYSYSGCLICSNRPYKYKVSYDDKNRVIELENMISEKHKFEFNYNQNGEICELKVYTADNELKKTIKLKNCRQQ